MPTDSSFFPTRETLKEQFNAKLAMGRAAGRVPGFRWAERYGHWALRLPLIAILWQYGLQKFPAVFVAPAEQGVPALLFILAAFGEVLGAMALFLGGIVETWRPRDGALRLGGDALTRGGALAGLAAVTGVIAFFYWPILAVDMHVLLFALALFMVLRGNR